MNKILQPNKPLRNKPVVATVVVDVDVGTVVVDVDVGTVVDVTVVDVVGSIVVDVTVAVIVVAQPTAKRPYIQCQLLAINVKIHLAC